MKALLVPLGSAGDVHPFLGLGHGLAERGHEVTILTNPHFEDLIRREGFDFVPIGEDNIDRMENRPEVWHPTRGFHVVAELMSEHVKPTYQALADRYVPGETFVLAGTLAMGARVAQEHLHLPLITIHLQPNLMRSVHEPPRLPGPSIPAWFPGFLIRGLYRFMDWAVIDRHLAPAVRELQQELGLQPAKRIFDQWIHSPLRTIGLYPDWYCRPQPDWPSQVRLTGFPLYDERKVTTLSPDLESFLQEGEAPVAFTPGSANLHAKDFFEAAAGACQQLGRRGLLLTRYPERQIPPSLPEGVRHIDFAPFSELLPRCAAVVHHGGIGSCAQGLAAGVPQLLMPMGFDQFDNAERLKKLGVGDWLKRKRFTASNVASMLKKLETSAEVATSCHKIRDRVRAQDAIAETCDVIENALR